MNSIKRSGLINIIGNAHGYAQGNGLDIFRETIVENKINAEMRHSNQQ
jgi:hypothetical protein